MYSFKCHIDLYIEFSSCPWYDGLIGFNWVELHLVHHIPDLIFNYRDICYDLEGKIPHITVGGGESVLFYIISTSPANGNLQRGGTVHKIIIPRYRVGSV